MGVGRSGWGNCEKDFFRRYIVTPKKRVGWMEEVKKWVRVHLSPHPRLRTSASELEKHRINTKNTRIRNRQATSYKNRKELSMISEVI